MRIAVIGAGGVGGYFGGQLAQAGHDVTFVARGRASGRVARARLTIESRTLAAATSTRVQRDRRPEAIGRRATS